MLRVANREGMMKYEPRPIESSAVALPPAVLDLLEQLAEHNHDVWAVRRLADGWTWGPVRDDAGKHHPCLVPYSELPEGEKEYDRAAASETLRAILALGYTLHPPTGARGTSATEDAESAALLERLRDRATDLRQLLGFWQGYRQNPSPWERAPLLFGVLADRLLKLGCIGTAQEVIARGLEITPRDVRLRQLQGLAWARGGATERANRVLLELEQEGRTDEETLGMLARTFKDLGLLAAEPARRRELLQESFRIYEKAYRLHEGYWTGINAATLALLLDKHELAEALVQRVRAQCLAELEKLQDGGDRYWALATLGEAALVINDLAEAEARYTEAAAAAGARYGDVRSTRGQARLLLRHLGHDGALADRWLPIPNVAVFVGHMIDQPGRPTPRFPPQLEEPVRQAIREALERTGARIGYASAACGADLLFQEVVAQQGGESHVVLPYDGDLFVSDSVDIIPGGDGKARFQAVLARANQVVTVSQGKIELGGISYDYANLVLDGLARVRAAELGTDLVAMAVWDGRPGDGPGGTAAMIARWRGLGLEPTIIPLDDLLRKHCPELADKVAASPAPAPPSPTPEDEATRVMALLFADAVGYSKLTDVEVPRFIQHFLGDIADLIRRFPGAVVSRNTWGDGLYLVFETVKTAGLFALDLCDWVTRTDWSARGLPRTLSLRIALHAGPVFGLEDPVTGQKTFTGSHVSRCARIEPITPPGQVYASQGFAALAAGQKVSEFICQFVKQAEWAKSYGTFPTYLVLRRG
jgi:hypothetical protein